MLLSMVTEFGTAVYRFTDFSHSSILFYCGLIFFNIDVSLNFLYTIRSINMH